MVLAYIRAKNVLKVDLISYPDWLHGDTQAFQNVKQHGLCVGRHSEECHGRGLARPREKSF